MSLLFINNTQETFTPTQSGALATTIWESCRVAARRGLRPTVLTRRCAADPFPWADTVLIDYPTVPKDRIGFFLCRADRKVAGWRYLRQREYAQRVVKAIRVRGLQDLPMVLSNDPEMTVILRNAFPQTRIVHWFHNQQECKEKFRKLFSGAVDAVTAVSGFVARWIEEYYRLPADSVRTMYNGVNSETFSPADIEPDGIPIVNFVGRTGIEKAPDLLLKAAIRVAQTTTTKFGVQMIGSNHWDRFEMDDYQRELSELAKNLEGLGVKVRRPGHIGRNDLPREFRKAVIHVVPSRWNEPSALTLYEGMACGLATVASRTGGTPEIVGDAGLLFERDSVEELAAHLSNLLTNPALRRRYAHLARQRAMQFTWDSVWDNLLEAGTASAASTGALSASRV